MGTETAPEIESFAFFSFQNNKSFQNNNTGNRKCATQNSRSDKHYFFYKQLNFLLGHNSFSFFPKK